MQTTLFKLLNAADTVILDGYEVEAMSFVDGEARVEYCGGDETAVFQDQNVTLLDGDCSATTTAGPQSSDGHQVQFTFQVTRLLQPSDLAA